MDLIIEPDELYSYLAMQPRMDALKASPAAYKAMLNLELYVSRSSGIEPSLLELVKLRASQINGCAFCIDMHTKDARAAGETEQRLYALTAWRETPFYTDRERAALAWTEAVTLIGEGHVSDEVYEQVRQKFTDEELVNLTLAVVAINGWNRLAIAFRALPGSYQAKGA
jgi:AhpD family alkylhydroperoxidase